jgi:hypothetical protein
MPQSFSAKSLLDKAKHVEALENAKSEAEIQAKKELNKIEAERKKVNQSFINEIGIRCVEKALSNEFYCLISDAELEKYNVLIKYCGLTIEKINVSTEELGERFPEIYEEIDIDNQLNQILDQLDDLYKIADDLEDENSHLLNQDLAGYNDQLYDIFECLRGEEWYLTLIEKQIAEEIECSGLLPSSLYENDAQMYQGLSGLLELLTTYKKKGIRDPDSDMESDATGYIKELISEIPTIVKSLKKHKSHIVKYQNEFIKNKECKELQIKKLELAKSNLLNEQHQVNIISWEEGQETSTENSFLNPKNLRWIMNNPLMKDLFEFIEKKILDKNKSCEIIFNSYGSRHSHDQYLYNGLFFDDFLVEISINEMEGIFNCLGYKVHSVSNEPKKDDPSNLIQKHILKISWSPL